jgi:glucose/arabinose dehydrogenase
MYGGTEDAQDPALLGGKVLRLRDDGSVPGDNPFLQNAGTRPEIFTLGHRTPQGMVLHPQTGDIWSAEMGPNGGDEINVLRPGGNYGWPLVSLGRDYPGPWAGEAFSRPGFENPVAYWMPSITVSGLAFYTGERLPQWQGDLFVAGLRYGEIPGTGQLQRIRLNAQGEEIRREVLLADLRQRLRGPWQGIDGYLYVLVDAEQDAAILRIGPAE